MNIYIAINGFGFMHIGKRISGKDWGSEIRKLWK